MQTTGIKLDETTKNRLHHLSIQKQRSPHWLMKKAIAEYLEREEEKEKMFEEDEIRWQEYLLTSEAIENEVAEEWLDSLVRGERKECPR